MVIKVSKVVIEIGKKTLELSPDEARELKRQLELLLDGEKTYYWSYYYPPGYYPNVIPTLPTITCSSFSSTDNPIETVSNAN